MQKAEAPAAGVRVISPETAREVRKMLAMATAQGGTAPKAQAIGYSVGGKTGTARKQIGKTYSNKYRAWFVGLAPVSNPRIIVAVMVDEPEQGCLLWRRCRSTGVQPGGAEHAAHDERAARHRRQGADRQPSRCRPRPESF